MLNVYNVKSVKDFITKQGYILGNFMVKFNMKDQYNKDAQIPSDINNIINTSISKDKNIQFQEYLSIQLVSCSIGNIVLKINEEYNSIFTLANSSNEINCTFIEHEKPYIFYNFYRVWKNIRDGMTNVNIEDYKFKVTVYLYDMVVTNQNTLNIADYNLREAFIFENCLVTNIESKEFNIESNEIFSTSVNIVYEYFKNNI